MFIWGNLTVSLLLALFVVVLRVFALELYGIVTESMAFLSFLLGRILLKRIWSTIFMICSGARVDLDYAIDRQVRSSTSRIAT